MRGIATLTMLVSSTDINMPTISTARGMIQPLVFCSRVFCSREAVAAVISGLRAQPRSSAIQRYRASMCCTPHAGHESRQRQWSGRIVARDDEGYGHKPWAGSPLIGAGAHSAETFAKRGPDAAP